MRDDLLTYYERELAFMRQMGADFAQKYPKIASRLQLEPDKCEDPHVERMIEAFSFLAARIHLKIDDEFPEITESVLNILYPHYLAPIPSMSIAQFALDPEQGKLMTGYEVEAGTTLYSKPIQGTPCRFRTGYPVTVWPIEVASVSLNSLDPVDTHGMWEEAVLQLKLRCLGGTTFSELKTGEDEKSGRPIERLRFYLNGDSHLTYALYEMIFNNASRIEIQASSAKKPASRHAAPLVFHLPAESIKPVGFKPDEGLLPYTKRSFLGYRLLTEYFAFPEKFLFFDLTELNRATEHHPIGEEITVSIYLKDVVPPRGLVSASTFQLGCSPIVNLFNKLAEPIHLTEHQNEYRIVPDVHRQSATEIYSVDGVYSTDPFLKQSHEYAPFYSIRHSTEADQKEAYWYATRRPTERKDDTGSEVYITLVDLGFNPRTPPVETLTIHTTASNRDLPSKLPFGGREGDFEVEGAGPLAPVRCLRKPTPTVRPALGRGAHWRLISHLSLNYLSISSEGVSDNGEALREILSLYNFTDSAAVNRHINGISEVGFRRVVRQTGSRIGTGFVRGIETTIEFDSEMYVGSGIFLFAAVLERFLGLYVTINSFNQLVARVKQGEGVLRRWQARAGDQVLL